VYEYVDTWEDIDPN
jgi:hypothetical protein